MTRYPIQLAKVQPPSLRDETLARHRLLDWLNAKIHDRVILVLADAGYGKTTLLADFARRTRLRTLWYRLEDDDRDWIAFLNHLVAAGREHDPMFAPTTASMLGDMSVGGPTRDAAIDVFLRELPAIAEHGAVLILDDFHLVDDSPDVRLVARELVARAPERMSIVFASRRPPTIPLAKLRAAGEVAELGTDDLRFDAAETRRLFADAYGRILEPDVLAVVVARTEGWAASLQLVQAALRDRTPAEIRRFVRGLSGADQELYDYLAEEVVGDLPEDLQRFLMCTSILQTVTPELAPVVAEISDAETARLTLAAERLTLLSRRSRTALTPQRYHPLVREFLEARLRLSFSADSIDSMHRRTAEAATTIDWRIAAHHFREASDVDRVGSIVAASVPEIMGSSQYGIAAEFMDGVPRESWPSGLHLVEARIALQRGAHELAIALSERVLNSTAAGTQESDHALLNLATMHLHAGKRERALQFVNRLHESTSNTNLRLIAEGMSVMMESGKGGSVDAVIRHLLAMAEQQRGVHAHYFGVSMLNLATAALLKDDPAAAIEFAEQAVDALGETSSRLELSSALMAKAGGLTMLGRLAEATATSKVALDYGQTEAILEQAELADSYDRPEAAAMLLESVEGSRDLRRHDRFSLELQTARFMSRRGQFEPALARLAEIEPPAVDFVDGYAAAYLSTVAYIRVAAGSADGAAFAAQAQSAAKRQGAHRWQHVAELTRAFLATDEQLSVTVASVGTKTPWNLTFAADLVGRRLVSLDDVALNVVGQAAVLHPGRWRVVLRDQITGLDAERGIQAAVLLEMIGDRSDVQRLRAYARRHRRLPGTSLLGRRLARRLADKVYIDDQNRVTLHVGHRTVVGSTIRRKVLALLCFLLTRTDMASTRDQVLEALWPDLDPLDAVNSLNQTVYFLRRTVEENYVDDLSPGYVHHDSDLIWLDRDLVSSRSNDCRALIRSFPTAPTPDQVQVLAERYQGRFALDFEYEEWAAPFRDWLHASFLEIVERAVASDIDSGHFNRGIRLARHVLDVDPSAEQVEVSLLRLYRASGAHAAAAEQYGHYAAVMREQLGVEPPPLETL